MKTIVVYTSKTGFTETYGNWIAQELKCEAIRYKELNKDKLQGIDTIIYGGGIMAGRVAGLDKVKKADYIKGKNLIVFATGGTSKDATEIINKMKKDNLSEDEQKKIPFYYFQGGINYEKMGFLSKTLLKAMAKSLEKKANRTNEETGMMEVLKKSNDNSNREYIKELVQYVEKCE